MPKQILRVIPVIVWSALIFYLSSQPAISITEAKTADIFIHKLAHVIEYCILYVLAVLAFYSKEKSKAVLLGAFLFIVIYGATDEIHQSFVPTRGPRFTDVLVDSVGGLIGFVVTKVLLKTTNH